MPSLFRATVGLDQHHWEWHKSNPGRLSRICQEAIDIEIALEALGDAQQQAAEDVAADYFFNVLHSGLQGDYTICNSRLVRGEATEEQIRADSLSLDIEPAALLDHLDREFARELHIALLRQI